MPSAPHNFSLRMCALLWLTTWLHAAPPPTEITLRLPGDQKLVFSAIPLGIGDGRFVGRDFDMGGRGSGGFRENLARVRISGGIVLPAEGQPDWHLVLGRHEITRAQWAALLGEAAPPAGEANLPIVNITRTQIAIFLEKANKWLHQNREASGLAAAVPQADAVFLRLPDEAEWEFAARGGMVAEESQVFDKRTPYTDTLNLHEWFAGAESSNGRLRPVGKLAPNPLGLHDMLGNASEITEGIYRLEYIAGRSGGMVTRGGNFRTSESEIRSSQRAEVPLYDNNGDPAHSDSTGFRLVLGSLIMPPGTNFTVLENAWSEYSKTRVISQTSVPANAPLIQQTAAESAQTSKLLDDISKALALPEYPHETIQAKINLIRPQLNSIQARINEGQKYFATAAIRLASVATTVSLSVLKKKIVYARLNDNDSLAKLDSTLKNQKNTLKECCEVAARIDVGLLSDLIDHRIKDLMAGNDPDELEQAECTRVAKTLLLNYAKHRNFELDTWQAQLEKMVSE